MTNRRDGFFIVEVRPVEHRLTVQFDFARGDSEETHDANSAELSRFIRCRSGCGCVARSGGCGSSWGGCRCRRFGGDVAAEAITRSWCSRGGHCRCGCRRPCRRRNVAAESIARGWGSGRSRCDRRPCGRGGGRSNYRGLNHIEIVRYAVPVIVDWVDVKGRRRSEALKGVMGIARQLNSAHQDQGEKEIESGARLFHVLPVQVLAPF
jgi:hypothetical protein